MKRISLISILCFLIGNFSHAQITTDEMDPVDAAKIVIVEGYSIYNHLAREIRQQKNEKILNEIESEHPEYIGCYYIDNEGRLQEHTNEECQVGEKVYQGLTCSDCNSRINRFYNTTFLCGSAVIRSNYNEFIDKLKRDVGLTFIGNCQYYGERNEFQGNIVQKYRAYNVFGHGNAYVYIYCIENKIKFIDVDFYEARAMTDLEARYHEIFAIYTWAKKYVFNDLYGEGEHIFFKNDDIFYNSTDTWIRPDNVTLTLEFKIFRGTDFKGIIDLHRCPILRLQYDVL